ncbi:hypothetical protein GZ59_24480 [Pectobacterium atrosepticum]|uniref:hypothetical protein n=1 Tax=Pectobacterium atrosepticum TaxID=29471 RepID=UPI0004E84AC3|nr:hypothetical protein [Pectobacterium atrosepticum]AIK14245.1 hypothetical protein GZ59_24480 [Pectobacterium atrosepticum]ATY91672.1 hypothetical protein CVS35_15555 [Pectobacterium atrosepticum]KFX13266.1 hypothetical protein JV34_15725 [Pectobacterium atrosepticum]QXE15240.1 hypothetical protein DCX48_12380 [Pectobacterium atrosepticum]
MTNTAKRQTVARKRRQRARQAGEYGKNRLELVLSDSELQMLEQNCQRRNPGREPYSKADYVSLLILCDNERLMRQEAALGTCERCNETLPAGCGGLFRGESACFFLRDFRQLNLTGVTGHAQLDGERQK